MFLLLRRAKIPKLLRIDGYGAIRFHLEKQERVDAYILYCSVSLLFNISQCITILRPKQMTTVYRYYHRADSISSLILV